MTLNLNGSGLFVFSDPGGAKPLLSLVKMLENQLSSFKVVSDRKYSFFKDFNIDVSEPIHSAQKEIQLTCPDFLFVGTSYTSKIELQFIKEANQLGIKTYAFVDHWTSFKERFILNWESVYPSVILVIDEIAKNKAIDDGIPNESIKVFGNPYHHFLAQWKPTIPKKQFFSQLGLNIEGKKIIVYAPDPLSNVNGKIEYGFDEVIATKMLCESIVGLNETYLFLLKLHPNQKLERIQESIISRFVILPENVDTNSLIYFSDLVLGFFSSFLIEAGIMKKPVLRFLIDGIKKDPLEWMNLGKIVNHNTLSKEIKIICK
jgi:hypothetical protein